ncbi:MAG: acyl-ACP--UDP-N-acetylglucosamine O-acyltransferase [Verrucomicrobiota bacterium]|jgi:UDP-N-acetylglucosamine acyltransferase|nr:acyl-ACP--UDP-N-acetylglucosamine O-acyltransferase [Verrucomicrobiota bacterium]
MIHPSAIIEPGAQLGADVQIGPFAYVGAHAVLGDGCILSPHAVVLDHATLGARCRVHSGAVIGDLPQDLSFSGEPSYVVTGDDCIFREGVTVHRGTTPGSTTKLGHHVFMMANSHIAHNGEVGNHVILANGVLLAGYVTVGDRCFFGGGAAIHQFCHIGRFSMVGGLTAITKDLPPFCITVTGGANTVAGLNLVGLRRGGFSAKERAQIKTVFKTLYHSGLNVSQARERLQEQVSENPFAAEYIAFLSHAKRGICPVSRRPGKAEAEADADA